MRRLILSLLVLSFSFVLVDRAPCAPPASGTFNAIGGSGISGKVSVHSSKTGSKVSIMVDGLLANVEYIAVWSSSSACDVGTAPPPPTSVLGRFRGDKKGSARVDADVSVPADQIHSVAVQVGNSLALVACAPLQ
jgi:hypothetical protein